MCACVGVRGGRAWGSWVVKGEVDSRVDGQGYWVIGRLLLEVQPLWFDEVGYIYIIVKSGELR